MTKKPVTHIKHLRPDKRNYRRHTPKNVGLIVDALHEVGAARSIVIDEDNNILAGNATIEAAAEAGITKVRVIKANGHEIIAVQRNGLTAKQKKELAVYDNKAAEEADGWEAELLAEDFDVEELLQMGFTDADFEMPGSAEGETDAEPLQDESESICICPKCGAVFNPRGER
jgi:ParB-like chromosome segregation protein Spo0J